ncbi:RING-H2 finger protein ATL11 [Linum perenne]
MLIMVIVLVVAFFFMGIISIYVRRCSHRRDIEDFHFEHLSSIRDPPGLDSDVIHTFPMFLYSSVKGLKIGKGGLECAVCISEFEDAETLRLIPACSHVFHIDCIDSWLVSHVTCPVCRADLTLPRPDPTTTDPTPSGQRDEPEVETAAVGKIYSEKFLIFLIYELEYG